MFSRALENSLAYKIVAGILDGLVNAGKESRIWGLIVFIVSRFRLYVRESRIVRIAGGAADWFGSKIRGSLLVNRFLLLRDNTATSKSSIFYRVYTGIRGALEKIFRLLRLDRLLAGSIFIKPHIWCGVTVVFIPLLPTMAVLGLALISYVSLIADLLMTPDRELRYFSINKYIYFYSLIYMAAALLSVSRQSSLKIGAVTVCFVLFFVVLINSIRTKSQLRHLVYGIISAGVIVSLYGFYQFIFPDNFASRWLDTDMFSDIGLRVYSTLANPNVLGEYLLLVIPFSVAFSITTKNRVGRLFFTLSALIMLVCLALTYSRGAYLGIILAAALFLTLLDRRFIVPGIIALFIGFLIMPSSIIERFFSIGNMSDSSTSYRVYIWMGTLAMLKDYWFSGIGPGETAFNMVYPVYSYNSVTAPHSHNLFLQIMCDTGFMGVVIFIAIIYQFFKNTFASLRREKEGEGRIYVIAGISAVCGFLVQSMTDYSFYNYRVMLMFWVVLGISLLFTKYSALEDKAV